MMNEASGSSGPGVQGPVASRFHSDEVPSAGTRSGTAWARQPNTASGSICPMTWRTLTAAGWGALRMHPSGAVTRTTSREPVLLGMAGPTMHRTPNEV